MRITNKMITTKYTRSLNNISYELDRLNTQVTSGRKFAKSSENTSAAVKAFQIRRDYSKGLGYQDNVQHAQSSLKNSESALMHLEELVQTASEKILQGVNSPQSYDERKIIATELTNIQNQLFQTLNSRVTDTYYFGGTNTDVRPFEIVGGKLQYNGYSLDKPLPAGTAAENEAMIKQLQQDSRYIDIGLNVQFDGTNTIDKSTVFEYSISGINIAGSGVTTISGFTDPVSNNLYDLLGAIAKEFNDPNFSSARTLALSEHFQSQTSNIIHTITEVGAKTSYLEFMTNRLETTDADLQETQLAVEGADPASTYIKFKSQQVAYNAALQMGTRIIQPSIFDFMS